MIHRRRAHFYFVTSQAGGNLEHKRRVGKKSFAYIHRFARSESPISSPRESYFVLVGVCVRRMAGAAQPPPQAPTADTEAPRLVVIANRRHSFPRGPGPRLLPRAFRPTLGPSKSLVGMCTDMLLSSLRLPAAHISRIGSHRKLRPGTGPKSWVRPFPRIHHVLTCGIPRKRPLDLLAE